MSLLKSVIADARPARSSAQVNVSPPLLSTAMKAPRVSSNRPADYSSQRSSPQGMKRQAASTGMPLKPATSPARSADLSNGQGQRQQPLPTPMTTGLAPAIKPRPVNQEPVIQPPTKTAKPAVRAASLKTNTPAAQVSGGTPSVSLRPTQKNPALAGHQPHKVDLTSVTGDENSASSQQADGHSPLITAKPLSPQSAVPGLQPETPDTRSPVQSSRPAERQSHPTIKSPASDERQRKPHDDSDVRVVVSKTYYPEVDAQQNPLPEGLADSAHADNDQAAVNHHATDISSFTPSLIERPTEKQSTASSIDTEEIHPQNQPELPVLQSRSSRMMSDLLAQTHADSQRKDPAAQTVQGAAEVRIGQVDVFIEKALPSSNTGGRAFSPAISMASRQYLRRL